jgi:hypothetical protein
MADKETEARRAKMTRDLDHALGVLGAAATRNYFTTFALALLATGASIAASILAFLQASAALVGVLALIPAMAGILMNRLKFQQRANWYYRKKEALLELYNQLHFELPDPPTSAAIAAISKKWTRLNGEMSGAWETSLALSPEELEKPARPPSQRG